MGRVVLDLPFPPSVNAIWRKWRGGVYRSDRYKAWSQEAGQELMVQRPGKTKGIYDLTLQFRRKDARRIDIGNLEKPVSDLLVEHGVIEDDSLARRITLEWVPDGPPCRAIVEPVEDQSVSAHKMRRVA